MVKETFEPKGNQVINLLEHHSPNLVSIGTIMLFLDTSFVGAQLAVGRAKKALEKEGHPLHGKAEIRTMVRVGYSLIMKE